MYKKFSSSREFSIGGSHAGSPTAANPGDSGSLHSFNYEFSRLYEPAIDNTNYYSSSLLSTAKNYSDTAIVVIGRVSGESNDSPKVQYKNCSSKGKPSDSYIDATRFYTNSTGLYPTGENHTNGSSTVKYTGVAYTDYRESVYMGYRWYETADEAGFWDGEYAKTRWGIKNGYDDVVQYPFGYGLSYTEFEWTITYLEIPNNQNRAESRCFRRNTVRKATRLVWSVVVGGFRFTYRVDGACFGIPVKYEFEHFFFRYSV